MSFKLPLEVGYFDPATAMLLPLTIDVPSTREAIVHSGGRLIEDCGAEDAQRLTLAAAMWLQAGRKVLGFIGGEFVVLHESGFLMTTLGYGPHGSMHAFLRRMCRDLGCQVYSPNEGQVVTEEILARLATWAEEASQPAPGTD